MIRFLFFFFVFFALFSLSAPVCFADVGLKDSPPNFSNLKRGDIPSSTIGQKGNTYISPTGSTPSTKFAKTPSGGLARNVLKWGKVLGRGAGGIATQLAYHVAGQAIYDLGKAYLDGQMQKRPALLDALDDALGNTPDSLAPGSKLKCSESGYGEVYKVEGPHRVCPTADELASSGSVVCSGVYSRYVKDSSDVGCYAPGRKSAYYRTLYYVRPSVDININPDLNLDLGLGSPVRQYPDRLNDDQLKSLADKLDDLLQKNDQLANDIADALDDLINKNPDYLDWDPIPSRDFEDAILQDKLDDALKSRENATDPAEIKQLDDLIDRLVNQKNRLDLDRQKEQERKQEREQEREKRRQERADKDKPDTCDDSNNNCNNDCNNNNNNCDNNNNNNCDNNNNDNNNNDNNNNDNNNCNNCPDGKCEVECKVEEKPFEPPDTPKPELKSIDFQPIVDLKGKLMEKFPFCLLTAFGSAINVLTAEPIAPWCEFTLGFGKPIVLDLSILDSAASFIRGVMSFCIFGLCGFGCFRMWSRF